MKFGHVSLIGRPNAGKSTLLNRLVGTKLAIVSDKPQTTRHRILGVRNYPPYSVHAGSPRAAEGPEAQVVYLDTPGIHRPLHRMNARMVDAAVETMRDVDVLGLVIDVTERPGKGDRYVFDLVKAAAPPVFLILNKIDLIRKSRLLPMIDDYSKRGNFPEIVPLSATTGENVDRLERAIVDRLPEGERRYPDDFLTDRPERFFAAEIVREKVLQLTRDEIPYSIAVVVDRFEEPDEGVERKNATIRVYCTIVVDRESQKPIVIGRGGDMIKRIGSAARLELEQLLDARVFLDLRVSVRSDWREDERLLGEMGVGES